MKQLFATVAAMTLISGCFGAPPNEKILTNSCAELFVGDERIAAQIAGDAGTGLDDFCGCFAAKTVAESRNVDLYKDIFSAMLEIRSGQSLSVEETAEALEVKLSTGAVEGIAETELYDLGEDFRKLAQKMSDAGGVCPAP